MRRTLICLAVLAGCGRAPTDTSPATLSGSVSYAQLCDAWNLNCPETDPASLTERQWTSLMRIGEALLATPTALEVSGERSRRLLAGWLAQLGLAPDQFPAMQLVTSLPWTQARLVPGRGLEMDFATAGAETALSNGLRIRIEGTAASVSLSGGRVRFQGIAIGGDSPVPIRALAWENGLTLETAAFRATDLAPGLFGTRPENPQITPDPDVVLDSLQTLTTWLFSPNARITLDTRFFGVVRSEAPALLERDMSQAMTVLLGAIRSVESRAADHRIQVGLSANGLSCESRAGFIPLALETAREFGVTDLKVDPAEDAVDISFFGVKTRIGLPAGLWTPTFELGAMRLARQEIQFQGPFGINYGIPWPQRRFNLTAELGRMTCTTLP